MSTPPIPLAEWQAEGTRLFGPDKNRWAFTCPACHHVATVANWRAVDAEDAIAYACVGRFDPKYADHTRTRSGTGTGPGPCNYTEGGLFKLSPVRVLDAEGVARPMFAFAAPPDPA